MQRKTILALVLLLLGAGAVALLVVRRGPVRPVVDSATVRRQATFRSSVTASGEIVATRYADIGSDTMGRIVELPVAEGDRVKAGQILARLDAVQARGAASESNAQVRSLEADERAAAQGIRTAEADLGAAESRSREAAQQLARKTTLHAQGLISTSELDTARAAAETAAAQLASSRAAADRARQLQDSAAGRVAQGRAQGVRTDDLVRKTAIVSPIDGVVTRLAVRVGEMVVVGIQNQPGTTLMTISDLASVNAEVKVAEADILRITTGQPATVTLEAASGRSFSGSVIEVGASALPVTNVGAASREFRVVIRLTTPDPGLRPGLTCDAEIITAERSNALTVPLQAVVLRPPTDGGPERPGVFVIDGETVRFTPVKPGAIGGLDIEVEGLSERTPIVVGPFQVLRELRDGEAVRISAPRP